MPVADQVKSLAEDIRASHGTRETTVSDIIKETQQTLGNFQQERIEKTRDLRRFLADNRRELANKTRELNRTRAATRAELASQVRQTRNENNQNFQKQAHETEEFLNHAEQERKGDFTTLIGEIRSTIAAIEKETEETLANFDHEHKERAEQLRKDVHVAVGGLMADFATDRQQSLNHWSSLSRSQVAPKAKPGRRA